MARRFWRQDGHKGHKMGEVKSRAQSPEMEDKQIEKWEAFAKRGRAK